MVILKLSFGEIAVRRRDHRAVMVAHQAVRMAASVESRYHFAKDAQKPRAIRIILENRFTTITQRRHVGERTINFNLGRSSYRPSLSESLTECYDGRPDPRVSLIC